MPTGARFRRTMFVDDLHGRRRNNAVCNLAPPSQPAAMCPLYSVVSENELAGALAACVDGHRGFSDWEPCCKQAFQSSRSRRVWCGKWFRAWPGGSSHFSIYVNGFQCWASSGIAWCSGGHFRALPHLSSRKGCLCFGGPHSHRLSLCVSVANAPRTGATDHQRTDAAKWWYCATTGTGVCPSQHGCLCWCRPLRFDWFPLTMPVGVLLSSHARKAVARWLTAWLHHCFAIQCLPT